MSPAPPRATGSELLGLAVPIILSNLSTPLLGAVATAAVGHLDDPQHLGAVTVGGIVFSFLYWAFGFLRMGTTGFTAQAMGRGAAREAMLVLYRAAATGAVIGLALVLLQWPLAAATLQLVGGSEGVQALARDYFAWRIWGAPGALVGYAATGWFIGRGETRTALLLQVSMNGANAALCLLFVVHLGWGAAGVGAAGALAELGAAALGLGLVARALRGEPASGIWREALDGQALLRLFALNRDIFLRTLCLIAATTWFTAEAARLGDTLLAANAVLMNFVTFASFALDGFAHATEVLVGRAAGAGGRAAMVRAIRQAAVWSGGLALAIAAVYLAVGQGIVNLLTGIEAVRLAAYLHLPWLIALPVVAVWSYLLDGVFIGALRGREMRNTMALSLAAFAVAVWLAVPPFGLHGLWLAYLVWLATRALAQLACLPRILDSQAGGDARPYSAR